MWAVRRRPRRRRRPDRRRSLHSSSAWGWWVSSPPQLVGGAQHCDPTTPNRCVHSFQNVWTYTGEITGTAYAAGTAALGSDGLFHAVAIEHFSGTVNGCGDGTLVIRQTGELDPVTGDVHGLVDHRRRRRDRATSRTRSGGSVQRLDRPVDPRRSIRC